MVQTPSSRFRHDAWKTPTLFSPGRGDRYQLENLQLFSLLVEQAPSPKYGAVKVSVVPFPSDVCSTRVVNAPLTGLDSVIVTGYGVAVPAAQSGTQLSSLRIPCPMASVWFHTGHVSPVAISPASPEK